MTPIEAKQVVAMLLAAFPSQVQRMTADEGKAMAHAYTRGLVDLDRDRAAAAVDRLIRTARFLPTVAEIRSAAIETEHGRRRAGGDAWGEVKRLISRWGYMRTPGVEFRFEDPLVAECVRALGWSYLCTSEDMAADRARFIQLYDQLAADARVEAAASTGVESPVLPARDAEHRPLASHSEDARSVDALLGGVMAHAKRQLPS